MSGMGGWSAWGVQPALCVDSPFKRIQIRRGLLYIGFPRAEGHPQTSKKHALGGADESNRTQRTGQRARLVYQKPISGRRPGACGWHVPLFKKFLGWAGMGAVEGIAQPKRARCAISRGESYTEHPLPGPQEVFRVPPLREDRRGT